MKFLNTLILMLLTIIIHSCGKVGPLNLPEDKVDRSIITYPCDEECQEKFEAEKKRQQSVILQTE
mgnify:CR=1 FL=1